MINVLAKDIKIAVQKKGRLREATMQYLAGLGFAFDPTDSFMISSCDRTDVGIVSLRDDDIPQYVGAGVADFGIVGENVFYENPSSSKLVKKLGFAKCSLIIAVKNDSEIGNVYDLEGKRIVTSYPNLLTAYLNKAGVKAQVVYVRGSAEAAPELGFAEAICDLVQTGNTLRENDLKPIIKIMDSEAILIESPVLKNFEINPFVYENT